MKNFTKIAVGLIISFAAVGVRAGNSDLADDREMMKIWREQVANARAENRELTAHELLRTIYLEGKKAGMPAPVVVHSDGPRAYTQADIRVRERK